MDAEVGNSDRTANAYPQDTEIKQVTSRYWEQIDRIRSMSDQYQRFGLHLRQCKALSLADLEGLPNLQELREAIVARDHWSEQIKCLLCRQEVCRPEPPPLHDLHQETESC